MTILSPRCQPGRGQKAPRSDGSGSLCSLKRELMAVDSVSSQLFSDYVILMRNEIRRLRAWEKRATVPSWKSGAEREHFTGEKRPFSATGGNADSCLL